MCSDHTYDSHRMEYTDNMGKKYCFSCAVLEIVSGKCIESRVDTLDDFSVCSKCGCEC